MRYFRIFLFTALALLPSLCMAGSLAISNGTGPTNTGDRITTLTGEITGSNSQACITYILTDVVDRGTNFASWFGKTVMAAQSGTFSLTLTNQQVGITHYYRCAVTDATDGLVWATATTNWVPQHVQTVNTALSSTPIEALADGTLANHTDLFSADAALITAAGFGGSASVTGVSNLVVTAQNNATTASNLASTASARATYVSNLVVTAQNNATTASNLAATAAANATTASNLAASVVSGVTTNITFSDVDTGVTNWTATLLISNGLIKAVQ